MTKCNRLPASYKTKLDRHLNRSGGYELQEPDAKNLMNENARVQVLLVDNHPRVFSSWRRHLEANGCHCEFAKCECEREVWNVLEHNQFDIVLSVHKSVLLA